MLPHRVCLAFDTPLIVLMIIGDGLTALSYMLIPFLLHVVLKDTTRLLAGPGELWPRYYNCFFASRYWLSTLFQSFILACGCGHILKVVVLYSASYRIQVAVDLWTGITSLLTVILLFIVRKSAIRCTLKQEK